MAEAATVTYHGSCHCGAVKFHFDSAPITEAVVCNCSMCGRSGAVMKFMTHADLKVDSGEDNLTDYQFNKKTIHHTFCKTCGLRPFARGEDGAMVNLRCVDNVDLDKLSLHRYDGKSV